MSEQTPQNEQEQGAIFQAQRVYLKDASIEMPNAPQIFLDQNPPEIEVRVDAQASQLADQIFESEVTVTVTAKVNDKVAYLVEAKQAGIFHIEGIPEDQMAPVLHILCPNLVYSYVRPNIADLITRTGFPPLHLTDFNFEGMFQQRIAQMQAEQDAVADKGPSIILPPGHA